MLRVDHVEIGYRFPLTEIQMGNIVTAVGNSEAKAAAFGVLRDRFIYNPKGLHQELLKVQGANPGWKISEGVPFRYCDTLPFQHGLTQRVYLDRDETIYGIQISEFGLETAIPLIGHLLDLSKRYDPSLVELCGGSSIWTPGTKYHSKPTSETSFDPRTNAVLKIKLYEYLLALTPIRVSKLARESNVEVTTLFGNINEMVRDGIVNQIRPQDQLIRQPLRISAEDLEKLIGDTSQTPEGAVFGVQLSTEQRKLLSEFTEIMGGVQRGDSKTLEAGQALADHYLSHPLLLSSLMAKARKHSSFSKRIPRSTTQERIKQVISDTPGMTIAQVIEALNTQYEQDFTKSSVARMIRAVRGLIGRYSDQKDGKKRWFYESGISN